MSIIRSIIYGFISGLAEFLPISASAHQAVMRLMFGMNTRNSFQELLVHIGFLFSIIVGCREVLVRLRREQTNISASRRRRTRTKDAKSFYDLRLLKTASIPLFIGLFLTFATAKLENNLLVIMGFLLINAVIVLLSEHTSHGNRDARTMTALDGIAMGMLGILSIFPGISRTGVISAYATARGADSKNACNWAFLLGIPAVVFAVCFDIVGIVIYGFGSTSLVVFIGYLFSGIAAFGGGYLGITIFKTVLSHSGFTRFSYYSIGVALFTFILYLIT